MEGSPNWQSRFATYDAAHYLYLAVHGYKKDDPSCAFYSLYPGLIYCGSLLIGIPFWSGVSHCTIGQFAWVIGLGIIPAITNLFLSYTRFVTMAVPVIIVLSRELGNVEIRYWLTVAAFGVFQLIFLFRHINFYWTG